MANPNIVNVTTITGKTAGLEVTTTATDIVNNPSSSGKLIKINSLVISNIDGVNSANATVSVYKDQTTSYYLASTVQVPENSTLIVIGKETGIYLEENDSIQLTASADGDLSAVCSYEEIS
jgi:hypothetical protein